MMFTADSRHVTTLCPSPNCTERRDVNAPDMLILHYTGMQDADGAIRWLAAEESEVSCHYVIRECGQIIQMIPEHRRAWHAGLSGWKGRDDINSHSIGIEIVNGGHDFGLPEFPAVQIDAVIRLCQDILERHPIPPEHVLGHSDIAPLRKRDPGEKFPWQTLWRHGVGHWVPPHPVTASLLLGPATEGEDVRALQGLLALYGYPVKITGLYDELTEKTVIAFQRHFRPQQVDGLTDTSTLATLNALLAARPSAGLSHITADQA